MAGANIKFGPQGRIKALIAKSLGIRPSAFAGRGGSFGRRKFSYKSNATAPQNATAADVPVEALDFCLHEHPTTKAKVAYYCQTFDANATNNAWVVLAEV